jgi:hypothetical protein
MELERFKRLHDKFNKSGLSRSDVSGQEYDEYIGAFHTNQECIDWHNITVLNSRNFDYTKHCCLEMSMHLSQPKTMPNGEDDPDIIVKYEEVFDEYGKPIYDGGSSMIRIHFCPWCGSKLRSSKRELWYEELSKLGFDDNFDNIPEKYQSDKWWRNSEQG